MGIDKGAITKCKKIAFLNSYQSWGQAGQGRDKAGLSQKSLYNYHFPYIYPSFFIIILKGDKGDNVYIEKPSDSITLYRL